MRVLWNSNWWGRGTSSSVTMHEPHLHAAVVKLAGIYRSTQLAAWQSSARNTNFLGCCELIRRSYTALISVFEFRSDRSSPSLVARGRTFTIDL